ncbi:hypothetical protein [Phosphitispora sp. TUW77]|uniref:hypothetical protein n=1 Tax=Phosphitispora sp. TUW77 TaxID=3152361 RepID=UPI003AB48982
MNKPAKFILNTLIYILFALYLFLFYELLIIPSILDWSIYGIIASLGITALLVFALPPGHRIRLMVLGLTFLLMVRALDNISHLEWYLRILGVLTIFIILGFTGRILGRITPINFLTVFLVALAINLSITLDEVPLWSEFYVKWHSPVLYQQDNTVDYFPLLSADLNRDGKSEIITQGNLAAVENAYQDSSGENRKNSLLLNENNQYLVFGWNGQTFEQLNNNAYSEKLLVQTIARDYINFPYYTTNWKQSENALKQYLNPLASVDKIINKTMRFGDAPFYNLALSLESIRTRQESWDRLLKSTTYQKGTAPEKAVPVSSLKINEPWQLSAEIINSQLRGTFSRKEFSASTEATAILSAGQMINGTSAQVVVLGTKLQVYDINSSGEVKLVNQITNTQIPDISSAEALLADVDSDGIDELMLNIEQARILKLDDTGEWKVLWASTDDSFRFEGYASLGPSTKPHIIALSKSNVRNNRTRYMTGYEYTPQGLKQQWRVFSGMINLTAADVDGDKNNELAGYLYKKHVVMVLEKHHLPVVPMLYGLTLLLALSGLIVRLKDRYKNVLPFLLIVITLGFLGGCTYKSGPKIMPQGTVPENAQTVQLDPADTAELLENAAAKTGREGRKFWFQGWTSSKIQKRKATSMFNQGTVDRDKGFIIDASILQQKYSYYRWNNLTYINQNGKWRHAGSDQVPLDPFAGFEKLTGAAEKMRQLPNETIMGRRCLVLQAKLKGSEIAKLLPEDIKLPADSYSQSLLDKAVMVYTTWIGIDDNFIYQYKTILEMPVPGAGSLTQETFCKFWDYNSPSIRLTTPDRIQPYLVEGL